MDKYELFSKCHSMNKEDIKKDIDITLERILSNAETDPRHSYSYYATLKNLLDDFKTALDSLVFMKLASDGWCYEWGVDYKGVSLFLVHYIIYDEYLDDHIALRADQTYTLYTLQTKLLTVEEFANVHKVEVGTVRQWIRRGKIRTAKKYGNEWRIPALTDSPRRGYTKATYYWSDKLLGLSEDVEFLNDYVKADFVQDDDDKKLYYIYLYGSAKKHNEGEVINIFSCDSKGCNKKEAKVIRCNSAEREKIELALIAQLSVDYIPNYEDTIVADLISYHRKEGANGH